MECSNDDAPTDQGGPGGLLIGRHGRTTAEILVKVPYEALTVHIVLLL
jgi:hypothetical protein